MATDRRFTMVGVEMFEWEPLWRVSAASRFVWFSIFASPESKNSVPGMIRGSVRSLGESLHLDPTTVLDAMDELTEAGLLEFDQERRIIRLTKLPDGIDAPPNGNVIKGWYTKFLAFPDCPIRNSHVEVLCQMAQGAQNDHARESWSATFAGVEIPVRRHRGRKKFDSDTSTSVQPSLFTPVDNSVDNSGSSPASELAPEHSEPEINNIRKGIETLSHTLSKPPVSVSVKGIGTLSSPDSGESIGRARLEPVPLPALPFSVVDMLDTIAAESDGRFAPKPIDERLQDALCATIRACEAAEVGLEDLRAVGRWFASGGLEFRSDLGPVWVAKPGNLIDAVAQARVQGGRGRASPRRVEPAPASAFGSGRRQI